MRTQIWAFVAIATKSIVDNYNTGLEGSVIPLNSIYQLKEAQNAFKDPDAVEPDVKCLKYEDRLTEIIAHGYVKGNSKREAQLLLNRWCHIKCSAHFTTTVITLQKDYQHERQSANI